jgi:hypothetical protein
VDVKADTAGLKGFGLKEYEITLTHEVEMVSSPRLEMRGEAVQ